MNSDLSKLFEFSGKYLRALAHCAAAFSVGVFTYKGRSLISEVEKLGRRRYQKIEQKVPKLAVTELLDDRGSFRVCEPEAVLGNVSMLETVVINQLIAMRRPMSLFEIGTFDGRTTLNMAANAPPGARVYTLDLPQQQLDRTALSVVEGDRAHIDKAQSGSRYLGTEQEQRITQLYGDSATFDFRPYLGQVDLVFIDGSHSYEYVMNDSRVAQSLLRAGKGVVLWHDYGSYGGVTKALNELHAAGGMFIGMRHIENTSLVCLLA